MSIAHVYTGRSHDLGGGFTVRRVLPGHPQRYVGPFIFFDHFGPTEIAPGQNIDVRPHPHIGLATVTYLFEGALMHRDSLGSEQRIEPGAVNWMTTGRGMVHSERVPDDNRHRTWRSHGLQIWVGLPQAHEETEPEFHHHPADSLPEWQDGALNLKLLLGSVAGRHSPVRVHSPMCYVDLHWQGAASWRVPTDHAERALYVVQGDVEIDGQRVPAHAMALLAEGHTVTLRGEAGTRAVLIAGAPLDGPRYIWWNFVSSRKERIEQAKADWAADRFARVPGETEFIPLPDK